MSADSLPVPPAADPVQAPGCPLFRHAGDHPGARALQALVCAYRSARPPVASPASGGAPMPAASSPVSLAELRRRVADMPALPPLVGDLLASFGHDTLDVSTLARRISADQGLLARTLKIANSPFYGLAGQVLTIDDAILVLGFRTVRALVLGAALVRAFDRAACKGFEPHAFWRHGVAVAVAARALAGRLGRNPESAFTAGLLHDIGRYVLAVCFAQPYQAVLAWQAGHDVLLIDAEQAVLGLDHAVAGEVLARQWGLPDLLVQDIALHHRPPGTPGVDLIHYADVLAHALELGGERDERVPRIDPAACGRLALEAAQCLPLLAQIETDFEEVCHALLS